MNYVMKTIFVHHQNTSSNDLLVDDIDLTNSGKAILARDIAKKVNKFLCQNSYIQRSFMR